MKNRLLSLIIVFCAFVGTMVAQQYSVQGKYSKDGAVVYLQNLLASRDVAPDSVVVKDGHFSFSGDADGKVFAKIFTENGYPSGLNIVLEGTVNVDLDRFIISGTEENNRLNQYIQEFYPIESGISEIQKQASEFTADTPQSEIEKLSYAYDSLFTQGLEIVKKACEENLAYVFPAFYLRNNFYYIERTKILEYADNGATYMQSPLMAPISKNIDGWRRSLPGVKITDVEEADTAGVVHHLTDYVGKGNYVLIDFWASWCGPCMREMPNVKALYEKYHPKGFDIVGLSFDRDKKAWIGAINRVGLPWHHLSDLKYWNTEAAKTYGVVSIPYTLLVGPDGTIIQENLTGEALAQKLAELYD
ncbi:MAG: AhpC/TSA family protein [Alloprevotella sp.]|nr:AhpC/TSA family protein [Alloprevotella sp.]